MKSLILFLFLMPIVISYSQNISVSRDTMSVRDSTYSDSIMIYNTGTKSLSIDSIYSTNKNFLMNISPNGDSAGWRPVEEYFDTTGIVLIQPDDSLKVRIRIGAILVKVSNITDVRLDSIYFYNNSTNNPGLLIKVTSDVTIGAVKQDNIPSKYILSQNYPNPFNPTTTISFSLEKASVVVLKVYNNLGEKVRELFRGFRNPGDYKVEFKGNEYPSGVYYYRLSVGSHSITKKMLLLK